MKKIIQTKERKRKIKIKVAKKRERKQYRQLRDHDFEIEQFLKKYNKQNSLSNQTKWKKIQTNKKVKNKNKRND